MEKNITWQLLLDLALLRKRPSEDFDFPLWQANLFVVLLAILSVQIGSDIQTMAIDTLLSVFILFLIFFVFVKIFLSRLRKGTPAFQGDFLKSYKIAVVASGLVDVVFSLIALAYELPAFGFLSGWEYAFALESIFALAVTLYSLAIFVRAFSSTFGLPTRAVLSETVIASILSFLVSVGLFMLLFMVLSMTGIVPESYYDTL